MRSTSWRTLLAVAAITTSAGILAGGMALRPALANGGQIKVGPFTIITCSSSSPCEQYTNTGSGTGLEGKTGHGTGLTGLATTTGTGVSGQSTNGLGVAGNSTNYYGVGGGSTNSYGVYAISFGSDALYADADGGSAFDGVVGTSSGAGYGVLGISYTANTAMYALAGTGDALDATADESGKQALFGSNPASGGRGADISGQYIGIIGRSDASNCSTDDTYPIVLTDQDGNDLMQVDCHGNMAIKGSYGTYTPIRNGKEVISYGSKITSPTVEDNGSAQLVNGMATVALDSAFAQTIDPHSVYHVMLTPDGDTRGLYIASKGPSSFIVREVQGGHGTLSFDYHIYAAALGSAGVRMAVVNAGTFGPRATLSHEKLPTHLPKRH